MVMDWERARRRVGKRNGSDNLGSVKPGFRCGIFSKDAIEFCASVSGRGRIRPDHSHGSDLGQPCLIAPGFPADQSFVDTHVLSLRGADRSISIRPLAAIAKTTATGSSWPLMAPAHSMIVLILARWR